MVILLNGPFGVGKTSAARRVVARLPNSMLYDPEEVGSLARKVVGDLDRPDDFQDLPLWRELVVATAGALVRAYGRTLVAPMTILRRDYFDEITAGLRGVDPELMCFRLTASEEELRARILSRPDEEGPHEWCLRHLETGVEAARDPEFGIEVVTDGRTPDDVADTILAVVSARTRIDAVDAAR